MLLIGAFRSCAGYCTMEIFGTWCTVVVPGTWTFFNFVRTIIHSDGGEIYLYFKVFVLGQIFNLFQSNVSFRWI